MFDLGTQELLVIFIVAFLVFGPRRLPELGRTLGKGIKELKSAMQGVKKSIEESELDVTEDIKKVKKDFEDSVKESIGTEKLPDLNVTNNIYKAKKGLEDSVKQSIGVKDMPDFNVKNNINKVKEDLIDNVNKTVESSGDEKKAPDMQTEDRQKSISPGNETGKEPKEEKAKADSENGKTGKDG